MAGETLGAIALLDPAIKIGRKAWKIYKLQDAFGEELLDYERRLYAESVMLDELLKTPIASLPDEYYGQLSSITSREHLRRIRSHEDEDDGSRGATLVLSTLA